ncbi:sugar transferase [Limosilactobacillus fermentum]|uniref:sugar transferase n=1 Tax=Limosilactobacillus fermentum TaxID=1613 RepID=UPI00187E58F5|nr:sugar transferase [Limosilactobacillus fermentum]MBE8118840.1 sugar transferase [Limosilactobacillus fermentum]
MEMKGETRPLVIQRSNARLSYRFFKRLADIVLSGIGLILLSWLFLILALCIKLHDGGPVFYSQTRVGKGQKKFRMWKFRSMVTNADKLKEKLMAQNEIEGAMFKMQNDPRVTKIGKFIRKYSLDELPQLWNVLIGDMSLVGPRPPLPKEVEQYTERDLLRLMVKPGCTGLWQVTSRSSASFSEMVNLDLIYIERRSLRYDFILILKTIKIMIVPNETA